MEDVKLLLVGAPNAGKSTLFNLLTRGHAKVGNWHGVTVGVTEGRVRLGEEILTVCDLPGIYSVDGMSAEEIFARDFVLRHECDLLLFVAECSSLERALPLLYALSKDRKCALVLTKRNAFRRAGGAVDVEALSSRLNIPVLLAEKGRSEFCTALQDALPRFTVPTKTTLAGIYRPPKEGLSKADKLFTNGYFLLPFFFVLLVAVFALAFAPNFPGEIAKRGVETLFDLLSRQCEKIPSPVLKSFLQKGVLAGAGSVLSLLPQIAILYLCLILLEESGLISRLALVTDELFSHIGLNGRAVFSLLMGFGCTAAATLTTRGLDNKDMQRRTILCLPYLPCAAKLPVFLTLASSVFPHPFPAVLALYGLGVVLSLIAARLFRPRVRPPLLVELDPLQLPRPIFVFKSLLFQLKQFIIKTATVILAFFLLSWLLSSFDVSFHLCETEKSMLAKACGGLRFLFAPVGMGDWRIAYAALSGLIAKENVAGAIAMLYGAFPYGAASAFAFAVFVLTCSPCVSAIAATARELGARRAILYAVLQTASALLLCYLAYFLVKGGIVFALLFSTPILAFIIVRNCFERVRRQRNLHPRRVHG